MNRIVHANVTAKPRGNNAKMGIVLCLASIFLAACDQNQTDERAGDSLDSPQQLSDRQADTNLSDTSQAIAPARKNNLAIAPGNIVVLALSTYDARAVVKSAQGELQAMQPGDVVQGTETLLVDVLEDRLVFEEFVTKPSGLKVKETVWVYKARDGVSRVQVLSQDSPKSKGSSVTKTIVVNE